MENSLSPTYIYGFQYGLPLLDSLSAGAQSLETELLAYWGVEWNPAPAASWGKSFLRAGNRKRKRRIDPPKAIAKRYFIGADQARSTKIKKMLKMKGGPNKLMKTKWQTSDKMAEAIKHLKTQ